MSIYHWHIPFIVVLHPSFCVSLGNSLRMKNGAGDVGQALSLEGSDVLSSGLRASFGFSAVRTKNLALASSSSPASHFLLSVDACACGRLVIERRLTILAP
ncbi:hypothetical protein K438DRAFT_1265678 [Mycena galopus ATCC 62051]|nr:hypothetical protein K438DRAFT_1265678 [Mycena galopus ATCC 62051]